MDARTVSGRTLGYVSDVEFDSQTGSVSSFLVGDGSVAQSLVGSIAVPSAMVRGHEDGFMVVDNAAAQLRPTGGAAAAAGEASAKARVQGAKAARGAGKAASSAVDRGSHALGRALGKAKRALEDASADEGEVQGQLPATAAQNVNVGEPQASGRLHRSSEERAGESPRTYRPAGSATRGIRSSREARHQGQEGPRKEGRATERGPGPRCGQGGRETARQDQGDVRLVHGRVQEGQQVGHTRAHHRAGGDSSPSSQEHRLGPSTPMPAGQTSRRSESSR